MLSDNNGDSVQPTSGPVSPDDVPDVLPADGAEPSAAPLPLLHRAPVTHAHVTARVDGAVHGLLAAHGALRPGAADAAGTAAAHSTTGGGGVLGVEGYEGQRRRRRRQLATLLDGRRRRHLLRRQGVRRRAEDPDLGGVPVDVEERPQSQRGVDVHEHGGRLPVLGELDRAVRSGEEAQLVADRGGPGDVLGDDPVLGPIEEHVRVLREVARVEGAGVGVGDPEGQGADVGVLNAQDLHDDALPEAQRRGREGVAQGELLFVPHRHHRVLAQAHVSSGAEVKIERPEGRVAVVSQRKEVLRRGKGRRLWLLWLLLLLRLPYLLRLLPMLLLR